MTVFARSMQQKLIKCRPSMDDACTSLESDVHPEISREELLNIGASGSARVSANHWARLLIWPF